MNQAYITKTAMKDLRAIWKHIAQDSIDAADRLLEAMFDDFDLIDPRI